MTVDLLEAVKGDYESACRPTRSAHIELACTEHLAALQALQEQPRQWGAYDGTLSQSAASLLTELAQTNEALARLQDAH